MNAVIRSAARWTALLVALAAGAVFLFALIAWLRTAFLPYNSEGRSFDGVAAVYYDFEPQYFAIVGVVSGALGAAAVVARRKLRRR